MARVCVWGLCSGVVDVGACRVCVCVWVCKCVYVCMRGFVCACVVVCVCVVIVIG